MDASRDVLLFANPIAGKGKAKRIARALTTHLTQAGYNVRELFDNPSSISTETLRDASSALAAITIGGDGTLLAVAERLLRELPPEKVPPLLVIPLGTANLMGKHLAVDWRVERDIPAQVEAALSKNKVRRIDLARANGRLFLLVLGAGVDAEVVHQLSRARSGPINYASYVLPAALALWRYTFPRITVLVDGRHAFGPAPGIAFVGNVAEYGTGFPILINAVSDDGLLDVCVLPCATHAAAIEVMLRAVVGDHTGYEGVVYTQGKRISISSESPIAVQIDGEAAGHTPVDIELLPGKLGFIVS